MKKNLQHCILACSIILFAACHSPKPVNPDGLSSTADHYMDSFKKADSLANYGPPTALDFSQVLDKNNDKKRVTIEGYIKMPSSSYVSGSGAQLDFAERQNEFSTPFSFILEVNVGTGKNTMLALPDKFKEEDIVITDKNGEKIHVGDRVKITGKFSVEDSYCSMDVQEIEKMENITVDYSKLNATKITADHPGDSTLENKMVYAEGTLDIPTMTVGGDYTFVNLYVAGIKESMTIDVAYGDGPSKLGTLPENYTENDFKIHDNKNNLINNKKKVRVYGLWKDKTIKVESIENI